MDKMIRWYFKFICWNYNTLTREVIDSQVDLAQLIATNVNLLQQAVFQEITNLQQHQPVVLSHLSIVKIVCYAYMGASAILNLKIRKYKSVTLENYVQGKLTN